MRSITTVLRYHSRSRQLFLRPRNRHSTSPHFFSFIFFPPKAIRSQFTKEKRNIRSRSTSCSSCSACTRFDYRSRFEDRLIASSVDEEVAKEVVGELASSSLVPTATATTTCRLPPRGCHEMGSRSGRAGYDWTLPRLTVVLCGREILCFLHALLHLMQTNFPDARSDFLKQ